MKKTAEKFPFESGQLYKIVKITRPRFSVCTLYEMVAHKVGKQCRVTSIFNPKNMFISQEIHDRLFSYYESRGLTKDEVTAKLSILGPKVHPALKDNEVAISKEFMYWSTDMCSLEQHHENDEF